MAIVQEIEDWQFVLTEASLIERFYEKLFNAISDAFFSEINNAKSSIPEKGNKRFLKVFDAMLAFCARALNAIKASCLNSEFGAEHKLLSQMPITNFLQSIEGGKEMTLADKEKAYRFRSRLEARWAVFFNNIGLEYEYEMEGFDMEECSYLPDFYIPSIDRWFEIKGQPLTVSEVQKCEQFCRRKDNENIKFSILIGAPKPLMLEEEDFSILGIREYTWQWPSQMYPSDTLLLAQGLTREEYYSRFLPAIWKVDGVDDKLLIRAIREARSARFEFGETPKGR